MGRTIVIVGASVSSGAKASAYEYSWAGRLTKALKPRGYTVLNAGVGGNKAAQILARFERDVVAHHPDFALFNMGLMNERIQTRSEFDIVHAQWLELVQRAEAAGMIPILGHCYGSTHYTDEMSAWITEMNRSFEDMHIPTINFYGAITDWTRHSSVIPSADVGDGTHPNDAGHAQMFYAIPPSLFDHLSGPSLSRPQPAHGHLLAELEPDSTPIASFVPQDPMGAFTVFLRFRMFAEAGCFTLVRIGEAASWRIVAAPHVSLVNKSGQVQVDSQLRPAADGSWHSVAITYNPLDDVSRCYVDGVCRGQVQAPGLRLTKLDVGCLEGADDEAVPPGATAQFDGASGTQQLALRELTVYRTRLTDAQILALHEGEWMKASLELYAPLDDEVLERGLVRNVAPTDAVLRVRMDGVRVQAVAGK
ncbi:MAG: hypothetical protein K6T83_15795 [Alicyclobacillus sp.]|nr:hypothetical protein [Alicyclobacillus sp.]